ncbi:hypothetical protein [Burkholderia vietnamiensis]|uniref:hypothetical protein n=1 Tax=Burkholderia vietnamiensis TaxID=60552 RepID=UPI001B9BCAE5|nr:hypothetical protein [Burkholderia vietnamiensis]MBR8279078.1 hypothetical protein [Burkholderia vietnamiensis]
MWQWSRETAELVVAQDHVSFCRRSAMNTVVPIAQSSAPIWASIEDAVASCLADEPKTKYAADIVISDAYARFWIVVPPKNASTRRDLRLCTLLRFEELFGDSPVNWSLQAVWHATKPFLACAIPLPLLNAIRTGMSSHRLSVQRCVPHFVAEWNRHCRSFQQGEKWFAVSGDSTLTAALVRDRRIRFIRTVRYQSCDEIPLNTIVSTLRSLTLHHDGRSRRTVILSGDVPETCHGIDIGGFHFRRVQGVQLQAGSNESRDAHSERASK